MKKNLAIASLIFAAFTHSASAALINASDYFNGLISANSTVQQADNTWQLGYLDNFGTFTLYDYSASGTVVGSGDQTKFDSFGSTYTGFGVNVSGVGANYFGDTIAPNELYAHPGNGSPDIVLRYYAATDGLFQFDTTIRNAHTGLVETFVQQGNTVLSTKQISKSTVGSTTFLQQLNLASGSTVDFIINDFNGYGADGMAIYANAGIAQVPEPGTMAIFGVALLAMVRIRNKA